MRMAGEPRVEGGALSAIFTPTLRQVLTWVGVTGVGGSGFAALCLGIGFLATHNHDEMLGLPSQAGASSALVRTGAMFFPNSLYYVLVGTWKATAVLALLALVAWQLALALRRWLSRVDAPFRRSWTAGSFVVGHALLLGLGLLLFEDRAATLDSTNRNLLLTKPTPTQLAARAAPPEFTGSAPALRYFAVERLKDKAARVGEELRAGAEVTRKHYGQSTALLGIFLAFLVLERMSWRTAPPRLLEWLIRPVLYLIAVVLVLTLPAAYGVLWIPNDATSVQITSGSDPPVTGYLLTDISGDEPNVWTLAFDDTTCTLRVFKRDTISEIRVVTGGVGDNLIHIANRGPAPAPGPGAPTGGVARAAQDPSR